MIMSEISIDTNILVYSLEEIDSEKYDISSKILDSNPLLSSQVFSEFINVCLKKLKKNKSETIEIAKIFLNKCEFVSVSEQSINLSLVICEKYKLQIFDSIIIANALDNNSEILYSEDMHHGLVIENKLKIINPYL